MKKVYLVKFASEGALSVQVEIQGESEGAAITAARASLASGCTPLGAKCIEVEAAKPVVPAPAPAPVEEGA